MLWTYLNRYKIINYITNPKPSRKKARRKRLKFSANDMAKAHRHKPEARSWHHCHNKPHCMKGNENKENMHVGTRGSNYDTWTNHESHIARITKEKRKPIEVKITQTIPAHQKIPRALSLSFFVGKHCVTTEVNPRNHSFPHKSDHQIGATIMRYTLK